MTDWHTLLAQAESLLADERDPVANAANLCALLYHALPDVNWLGFYFRDGDGLVVGPFQGRPACVRLPLGKGVCGTAAARAETVVVADVDAFDGHIACDSASRAEIVVPLVRDGVVIGVLDVDSPTVGRFDDARDRAGFEAAARIYVESVGRDGGLPTVPAATPG